MNYSIVVPNYNGRHFLETCFSSLLPQVDRHGSVVLVDNGSTDGSEEMIKRKWPEVTSIYLGKNTGFTGANNAGAGASDSDVIILLNNDTRVGPGWISSIMEPFQDETVGAVTSSMRRMDRIAEMDSAGGQLDTLGYPSDRGRGELFDNWSSVSEILFPCGGAMAVRRKALDDPGSIFWEKLFIYSEDQDLGIRLWKKRYRVLYQPSAVVEHVFSGTTGRGSPMKSYLCSRNRLLVMKRHIGKEFDRVSATFAIWEALSLSYLLSRGKIPQFNAALKGAREGFRTAVECYGSGKEGCRLLSRFMKPTQGTAMRRKLGMSVGAKLSAVSDR